MENNQIFRNLNPKCEPQLGRRGLYQMLGGQKREDLLKMAIFWVLNFSDGEHTLLDIAKRVDLTFEIIYCAAILLKEKKLIEAMN